MTQEASRPTYTEAIEEICNSRTTEEVRDDEWTDDVKAAIQKAATTYGKTYAQVSQDVDVESPQVHARNFEERQVIIDALNLGPYPGGER
jgi:methenyltetrahydromethanopterin cyclohydrolase